MSFRYMNPGYGALLGDTSVSTIENSSYSKTGVSFQKAYSSGNTAYKIEVPLPSNFTSDIWCRFDLYCNNVTTLSDFSIGGLSTRSSSGYENFIGIKIDSNKVYCFNSNFKVGDGLSLKLNGLNSVWFHCHKISNEDFTGELVVNGVSMNTSTSSNNYPFSSAKKFGIYLSPTSAYANKIFVSNLIISDEYISPMEQIAILPISITNTDMTAGENGIYIADTANQSLLQKANVASLIENYGANSTVTGIALVGNPAYKTGEGITTLKSLSKSSDTITEHTTVSLSDDTTAYVMAGWSLNNTTIADLQNMQFGWKVGA